MLLILCVRNFSNCNSDMIFQCPLREYWRNIFISETLFWQAGKVQLDIQKNFWNFNNSKEREQYLGLLLSSGNTALWWPDWLLKVGCAFTMVIRSGFSTRQYGGDDHREDVPYFTRHPNIKCESLQSPFQK